MQFLVPHKMNFGDNSNIINAPLLHQSQQKVFIKNNNHNNNNNNNNKLLATSSQEENFNENKRKTRMSYHVSDKNHHYLV